MLYASNYINGKIEQGMLSGKLPFQPVRECKTSKLAYPLMLVV